MKDFDMYFQTIQEAEESKEFSMMSKQNIEDMKFEWTQDKEQILYMLVKKNVESQYIFNQYLNISKEKAIYHFDCNQDRIIKTNRRILTQKRINLIQQQQISLSAIKNSLKDTISQSGQNEEYNKTKLENDFSSISQGTLNHNSQNLCKKEEKTQEQQIKHEQAFNIIYKESNVGEKEDKNVKMELNQSSNKRWTGEEELTLALIWKLEMMESGLLFLLPYSEIQCVNYLKENQQQLYIKVKYLVAGFRYNQNLINFGNKNLASLLKMYMAKIQKCNIQESFENQNSKTLKLIPCFVGLRWIDFQL